MPRVLEWEEIGGDHRNASLRAGSILSDIILFALWEGWKASQNTYLSASEQVCAVRRLHSIPVSNRPVPQHASSATSNPVTQPESFSLYPTLYHTYSNVCPLKTYRIGRFVWWTAEATHKHLPTTLLTLEVRSSALPPKLLIFHWTPKQLDSFPPSSYVGFFGSTFFAVANTPSVGVLSGTTSELPDCKFAWWNPQHCRWGNPRIVEWWIGSFFEESYSSLWGNHWSLRL